MMKFEQSRIINVNNKFEKLLLLLCFQNFLKVNLSIPIFKAKKIRHLLGQKM
jgi:hypothetical protein